MVEPYCLVFKVCIFSLIDAFENNLGHRILILNLLLEKILGDIESAYVVFVISFILDNDLTNDLCILLVLVSTFLFRFFLL